MAALTEGLRFLLRRLLGFSWDLLVIFAYVLLLVVTGLAARAVFGPLEQVPALGSPTVLDGLAFLILVLPVILYFAVQEARSGATWGRRKVALRVAGAEGRPLSISRALLRNAGKFLPWQFAHTGIYHVQADPAGWLPQAAFGAVYALVIFYTVTVFVRKDHRTPYDWISGAFVTSVQADMQDKPC